MDFSNLKLTIGLPVGVVAFGLAWLFGPTVLSHVSPDQLPSKVEVTGPACTKQHEVEGHRARFELMENSAGGVTITAPEIPGRLKIKCRYDVPPGTEEVIFYLPRSVADWDRKLGRTQGKDAGLWIGAWADSGQPDQILDEQVKRIDNAAPKISDKSITEIDPRNIRVEINGENRIVLVIEIANPWQMISPTFSLGRIKIEYK